MKKLLFFALIILLLLAPTGCVPTGCQPDPLRYNGKYPELHVVATNSILGVLGQDADNILVLDEDDFGRVMFAFTGDTSHEEVIAVLVAQKTTKTHSYFYDGANDIFCPLRVAWPYKLTRDLVSERFTDEQIAQLKQDNDWNKEIDDSKLFKAEITIKKNNDIVPWSKRVAAYEQASPIGEVTFDDHYSYNALLTTDADGKSIYYIRGRLYVSGAKSFVFTGSYLFMFDKDGTLIDKTGTEEVTDFWNYHDQLRRFKEINGWRF